MDAFLSQIIPWTSPRIPKDFHLCDGTILQIIQNQALFALIGNLYGGNGTTTFALPDLRGRVVLGAGQQPGSTNYNIGTAGGSETVALTATQIPVHSHVVYASNSTSAPGSGIGTNNLLGTPINNAKMYVTSATNTQMHQNSVKTAGTGAVHENMQPFQVVNYIICTSGLFPSRW
ncbi:MAG TPA: tail fiber protein [Mobilitalea sp.]|nr:tail fiber protein [Mobilitalea sp.]